MLIEETTELNVKAEYQCVGRSAMTFGGRDLKIPSGGDADFLGSSLQNCTRSGKRFHYK